MTSHLINSLKYIVVAFCLSTGANCAALTTTTIGSTTYTNSYNKWVIKTPSGDVPITSRNLHYDLNAVLSNPATTPTTILNIINTLVNGSQSSASNTLSSLMARHIISQGHLDPTTLTSKPHQRVFLIPNQQPNLADQAKAIADGICDGSLVQSIDRIKGYWKDPGTGEKTGFCNTVDIFMTLKAGTVFTPNIAKVRVGSTTQITNKAKLTLLITDVGTIGKVFLNTIHPIP